MIITLTPNPSIDRTAALAGPLVRGAVHRLESVTTQAAGKGVNISRAAVAAGVDTLAVVPADSDSAYVAELRASHLPVHPVAPAGSVRINLSVTEPDGTTTKLNSPGDHVDGSALLRMSEALVAQARAASARDWVVIAGSVPPGTPAGWYADLVGQLRATPPRIAVDTSDAPLLALIASLPECAPDLIKPNGSELASLTGADPDALEADPHAVAVAARDLVDRGIGAVLATMGSHGAVLVTGEGAWYATPPPVVVVSTVGAGDSSLFGYLYGCEQDLAPEACLASAVAYGSAAAALPGTTIPSPHNTHPQLAKVRQL